MPDIPQAAIDAAMEAGQEYTDRHAGPDWIERDLVIALLQAAWPHLHTAEHGERDCKTANLDRRGSRDVRQGAALRVGAGEGFGFGKVTASA